MSELTRKFQEEYLPVFNHQIEYLWEITGEKYMSCTKHTKALIAGIFLTVFGVIVLSFDGVNSQPGTTVVREKIFGIETRYFLVYFNGLLLYLSLLVLMEETPGVD